MYFSKSFVYYFTNGWATKNHVFQCKQTLENRATRIGAHIGMWAGLAWLNFRRNTIQGRRVGTEGDRAGGVFARAESGFQAAARANPDLSTS